MSDKAEASRLAPHHRGAGRPRRARSRLPALPAPARRPRPPSGAAPSSRPGEPGAGSEWSRRSRRSCLEPRAAWLQGGDASPGARVRSAGLSSSYPPHPFPISRRAAYPHPTQFLGDPAESSRLSQTPPGATPRPRGLKGDPEQKSSPQAWAVVGIHFEPEGWLRVAPDRINPLRFYFPYV